MDIMSKFNLPKYLKGKSFSEASKCIADKFKDRNSPEDIETMNELQGRLKQAQEYVKAEQEARTKPQAATADDFVPGEQNTGAGAPAPEQKSQEYLFGGALGGAVKGVAKAGATMAFGPLGGPLVDGIGMVADMFSGPSKSEIDDKARRETYGAHNEASNAYKTGGQLLANSFRTGADLDPPTGDDPPSGGVQWNPFEDIGQYYNKEKKEQPTGDDPWNMLNVFKSNSAQPIDKKVEPGMEKGQGNFMKPIPEEPANEWWKKSVFDKNPVNPVSEGVKANTVDSVTNESPTNTPIINTPVENNTPVASQVNNRPEAKGLGFSGNGMVDSRTKQSLSPLTPNGLEESIDLDRNLIKKYPEASSKKGGFNPFKDFSLEKAGDILGSAARYAPAAMNLAQLANLKKPDPVSLDRLGNRYNEQRVDERGLQNSVRESVDNNRDAILSSSGGSGSAARSNLIASQLQGSKAMSNAYQSATGENRQEARNAQKFNLGIDQANIAQANNETNLNLEQRAAYQTNKSKLLSQLGNDIGGVGTEELFKKYPELMGMNYNWKGKHKGRKKSGIKTA